MNPSYRSAHTDLHILFLPRKNALLKLQCPSTKRKSSSFSGRPQISKPLPATWTLSPFWGMRTKPTVAERRWGQRKVLILFDPHIFMRVYIYIHIYTYIYIYVLIGFICANKCVYAFIFIMFVHIHIHIYAYKHTLRLIHSIQELQRPVIRLWSDSWFEAAEGFNHRKGDKSNNKDWIWLDH